MPKSEHNGENFKYIITWQADGEDTVHSYEETNGSVGRKEIEVGGIYKPYTIKVSAKNSIGEPYSPAETVRGFSGEAGKFHIFSLRFIRNIFKCLQRVYCHSQHGKHIFRQEAFHQGSYNYK